MIIQCPACGARAKLPDNKEGAKVRCSECEKIYVAGGRGAAKRTGSPTMPIAVGAGVIGVILIWFASRQGNDPVDLSSASEVIAEAPSTDEITDMEGWESPLVQRARKFHRLAYAAEAYDLQSALAWPQIWARLQNPDAQGATPPTETAGYGQLNTEQLDLFRTGVMDALISVDASNLVGGWKPFNGSLISQSDEEAHVRLDLEPRSEETGTGTRSIDWYMIKDGAQWKAWSWERYQSASELKTARIKRKKKYAKKTLSDGSKVIEGKPGPIDYMESTPLETRQEIDGLIAELLDLELPARQLTKVKKALIAHGKDAVPPLLTKFYLLNEAGFEDMDQAISAQLVHSMLSEITGYVTTFSAHEALGATVERRDSGVRQWFGWYNRKFKKFTGREEQDDVLAETIGLMNERERREYDKTVRKLKAAEENKNPHRKDN